MPLEHKPGLSPSLPPSQNIGQMLRRHFHSSQFIVVSLKDGMFNNANVLFKTKFVDGVSTVTRCVGCACVRLCVGVHGCVCVCVCVCVWVCVGVQVVCICEVCVCARVSCVWLCT